MRRVFIGDAKATETPGRDATQRRLRRYAAWAANASAYGEVVLTLCVGRPWQAGRWAEVLRDLGRQAIVQTISVAEIGTDLVIAMGPRSAKE